MFGKLICKFIIWRGGRHMFVKGIRRCKWCGRKQPARNPKPAAPDLFTTGGSEK